MEKHTFSITYVKILLDRSRMCIKRTDELLGNYWERRDKSAAGLVAVKDDVKKNQPVATKGSANVHFMRRHNVAIDFSSRHEITFWSRKFNVSRKELEAAAAQIQSNVACDLEDFLKAEQLPSLHTYSTNS